MSTALELARQKKAQMKAEGKRPKLNVSFTGEEIDLIEEAASRSNEFIDGSSMREFVKAVALKVAKEVASQPKAIRSTKTPEQLKAEAEKLLARASALEAQTK